MPETVPARRAYAALTTVLLIALALAGCTSESPGPVGTGVPGDLEVSDPTTSRMFELSPAGHLALADDERAYDEAEVLLFGHDEEDSSSILVRYDLSSLPDSFPDWTQMDDETILSAKLTLYRLEAYTPDDEEEEEEEKQGTNIRHYVVNALDEPLDTSLYPGPEPAYGALLADEFDSGQEPFIDLNVGTVIDWAENGSNGIIIREGDESHPGLVGYASRDILEQAYGEIESLINVDSTLGISLKVVAFDTLTTVVDDTTVVFNELNETFVFGPVADVSTLHARPTPSADLGADVMLQTHLRISPYFAFDNTLLPQDAFINRAVVRLAIDFDRTFGQLQSMVLHEVAPSLVSGVDTLSLQTLEDEATTATGQFSVDYGTMEANELDWVGWDVTSTLQRIVNGVLEPETVFLLTAGESFSGYLTTSAYEPDFYYSRYVMRGTDELVLKPHLEITYTPFSGGAR